MPACISRGEKSKFDQRCQESRLNEFTDCGRRAKLPLLVSSAPRGVLPPPSPPTPAWRRKGGCEASAPREPPMSGSPSTHMQSSKHLLFRPRLWGVQRCSRRSQQVPAHTAKAHAVSHAERTLPVPCTRSHWTRDTSSPWWGHPGQDGPSGAQGSQLEPLTNVTAEAPGGGRQRPPDAPDGQLIDHGRSEGAVGFPPWVERLGAVRCEVSMELGGASVIMEPTSSLDRWGNRSPREAGPRHGLAHHGANSQSHCSVGPNLSLFFLLRVKTMVWKENSLSGSWRSGLSDAKWLVGLLFCRIFWSLN